MGRAKTKKFIMWEKPIGVVDPSVGNYGNHPFFIRKASEATAFLERVGLPEGWEKGERMFPVAKLKPSTKTAKKGLRKKPTK